ncbi:serine/threonine-protein kinase [Nocardia sp. CNY236]|uniref:serine/threonine-protein kinase n=1 Tax=Nocardia sp. CNY236 TaxID=1169152 RepID=UPI0004007B15|nr:serine/threonine-protein kinase [Nocardia sp. CNY236]
MQPAGPRTGTRFGPYELRSLLGKGGMGEVYEAYDTVKDRMVAVKLLSEDLARDPTYQARFQRESLAAARLAEPHVIPIHDWGAIDGVLFIDMRLVRGVDLRAVLRSQGPLAPARAVGIIEQVAAALDAAHAANLVHRDVKPANILVTDADFAYLADFGIAHTEGDSAVTLVGMAIGSYIYMAPERFDAGPVTGRADVYSLACVLHECLTGATPFPVASMPVLIKSHLTDPPPRPSAHIDGIPPALDDVVERGMAKDPSDRFPTATALGRAARAALDNGPPPRPTLVVRAPERTPPAPQRTAPGAVVPPESTGELSVPAVIHPSAATAVRPTETQFTPLPPANEPLAPPPGQGGPPPLRPFPDAHLYPDSRQHPTPPEYSGIQAYSAPTSPPPPPPDPAESAVHSYPAHIGAAPSPLENSWATAQSGHLDDRYTYDNPVARSPDRPGHSIAVPIMVAVLAIVAVAVGGAIAWQVLGSGGVDTTSAEPNSAPVAPAAPSRAGLPSTPPPSPRSSATAEPTAVALPVDARPCGGSGGSSATFGRAAAGSGVTTCEFAEEVRRAFAEGAQVQDGLRSSSRTVVATSPVTGQAYTMACQVVDSLVTCTGGSNAVVYIY